MLKQWNAIPSLAQVWCFFMTGERLMKKIVSNLCNGYPVILMQKYRITLKQYRDWQVCNSIPWYVFLRHRAVNSWNLKRSEVYYKNRGTLCNTLSESQYFIWTPLSASFGNNGKLFSSLLFRPMRLYRLIIIIYIWVKENNLFFNPKTVAIYEWGSMYSLGSWFSFISSLVVLLIGVLLVCVPH